MSATSIAKKAGEFIGKGAEHSGMCERFTRTCFGFSAKYGSAKLAYEASRRDGPIHRDYNAPAGVPVFWDIVSGKNAPYDHVAVSVGGGYCVSTSAGPGGTVAKVKIADLTKKWGMVYRGWAEFYHGVRVYSKPKVSKTGYPFKEVKPTAIDLKSGWYRLLGALGYKGTTTVRLQHFLKQSGHYKGRIDNDWGSMTTAALQRRLQDAAAGSSKVLYPGRADGKRGTMTRNSEASYLNAHAWRVK